MARRFEDLETWQLGRQLKIEIYRLIERPGIAKNFKLRDQLSDAASSVCANIAEGFGRRSHPDFARFLGISFASLKEIENHLIDVVDRGYATDSELVSIRELCRRLGAALASFIAYLNRTPTPKFPGRQ